MAALKYDEKEKIKQRLSCALCFDLYESPRIFPCFHSFCKSCVEKLDKKTKDNSVGYECPFCRRFIKDDDIQDNFFLSDLVDLINDIEHGSKSCEQCDGEISQWRCMDCKITVCSTCQAGHLKIPICKGHRIIPIDDETSLVLDRLVFCSRHVDEVVKFHCKTCQWPICIKCKILEHDNHTAETIESAVDDILLRIKILQGKYHEKIAIKEKRKQQLELFKNEIQEGSFKTIQDITEISDALIKRIQADWARITRELELQGKVQIEKIDDNLVKVENEINECEGVISWAETVAEKSKGATLMQGYYSGLHEKHESLDVSENEQTGVLSLDLKNVVVESANVLNIKGSLIGKIKHEPLVLREHQMPETIKTPEQLQQKDCEKSPKPMISNKENFVIADFFKDNQSLVRTINAPNGSLRRLYLVKHEIWIPLETKRKIYRIPIDLDVMDERQTEHYVLDTPGLNPIAVTFGKPNIFLASSQGLCTSSIDNLEWKFIAKGSFHDVACYNDTLVAACLSANEVHIYKKTDKQPNYAIISKIEWKGYLSRVICIESGIYLHFSKQRVLRKYSLLGKELSLVSTKTSDYNPNEAAKLCMVDDAGSMLFADWYNNYLEVHVKYENHTTIKHVKKASMETHNDAIMLDTTTLMVLAGNKLHVIKGGI